MHSAKGGSFLRKDWLKTPHKWLISTAIISQFSNPYVYHLDCSEHRKGYRVLFKYIDENLLEGESIELYTCLDGAELKESLDSLNIVVNLKTKHFQNDIGNFELDEKRLLDELSERFSFRERQYVLATK